MRATSGCARRQAMYLAFKNALFDFHLIETVMRPGTSMTRDTGMCSVDLIARLIWKKIGGAFAIAVVPACLLAVLASAASACEFRSTVIRSTSEPATQLHEFRISLNQPNYENLEATKQHLTFATV